VAQLLFLQSEDIRQPIHMYINSPGVCGFVPRPQPSFLVQYKNEAVCVVAFSVSFSCKHAFSLPPPHTAYEWSCVAAFFSIHTLSVSLSLAHVYTNPTPPSLYAGGSVTAGLGIYDTMQYIQPPVATWCVGQACSMGAFLLAAGAWGMRHCLPHSRVMIHQPHGTAGVSDDAPAPRYRRGE